MSWMLYNSVAIHCGRVASPLSQTGSSCSILRYHQSITLRLPSTIHWRIVLLRLSYLIVWPYFFNFHRRIDYTIGSYVPIKLIVTYLMYSFVFISLYVILQEIFYEIYFRNLIFFVERALIIQDSHPWVRIDNTRER